MVAKRVPCVALVRPQPDAEALALGLQPEAAVLGVDLLPHPVLQLHQEAVVALLGQVVDVLQTQPVLTVDVPKAFLLTNKIKYTLLLLSKPFC